MTAEGTFPSTPSSILLLPNDCKANLKRTSYMKDQDPMALKRSKKRTCITKVPLKLAIRYQLPKMLNGSAYEHPLGSSVASPAFLTDKSKLGDIVREENANLHCVGNERLCGQKIYVKFLHLGDAKETSRILPHTGTSFVTAAQNEGDGNNEEKSNAESTRLTKVKTSDDELCESEAGDDSSERTNESLHLGYRRNKKPDTSESSCLSMETARKAEFTKYGVTPHSATLACSISSHRIPGNDAELANNRVGGENAKTLLQEGDLPPKPGWEIPLPFQVSKSGQCGSDSITSLGVEHTNSKKSATLQDSQEVKGGELIEHTTQNRNSLKTESCEKLRKFLRQNNLELKVVPTVKGCHDLFPNSDSKLNSVAVEHGNVSELTLRPAMTNSNGKRYNTTLVPINLKSLRSNFRSEAINRSHTNFYANSKLLLQLQVKQPSVPSVIRTTPQGTFTNWRVDGRQPKRMFKVRGPLNGSNKQSNENCKNRSRRSHNDRRNISRIRNENQDVNEYNEAKLTSCLHYPVIPLSTAFNDIEVRDRAAIETIQSLGSSKQSVSDPVFKLSEGDSDMRTLSTTMKTTASRQGKNYIICASDPVLTSAVTNSEESDKMENFTSGDLPGNHLLLPSKNVSSDERETEEERSELGESMDGKCDVDTYNEILGNESVEKFRSGLLKKDKYNMDEDHVPDINLFHHFSLSECKLINSGSERKEPQNGRENAKFRDNDCGKYTCTAKPNATMPLEEIEPLDDEEELDPKPPSKVGNNIDTANRVKTEEYANGEVVASDQRSDKPTISENFSSFDNSNELDAGKTQLSPSMSATEEIGIEDNWRQSPPEDWSDQQVKSWLEETLCQISSEDIKPAAFDSRTLIDQFNSVNGRLICALTLRDFRSCFSNLAVAEKIFAKLQKLKNSSSADDSSLVGYRDEMHNAQQYLNPISTMPGISLEQLEESVSFHDLLGSDNIFGSMDLADIHDSQNSLLKSLEHELDNRQFPNYPSSMANENAAIETENLVFSNNCNVLAQQNESVDYRNTQRKLTTQFCCSSLNVNSRKLSIQSVFKNCYEDNMENLFFHNPSPIVDQYCNNKDGSRVKQETFDHSLMQYPTTENNCMQPNSPSAYYTNRNDYYTKTGNGHVSDARDEQHNMTSSEIDQSSWQTNGTLKVLNAVCTRDPHTSDTDSGIHSPDSTPGRNICGGNGSHLRAKCEIKHEESILNSIKSKASGSTMQPITNHWVGERGLATNLCLREVHTVPEEPTYCGQKVQPSSTDVWEHGSTCSSSSTISLDSETRLLNLDDCKTYVTGSSYSSQDNTQTIQASLPSVHTVDGNVVFISADSLLQTDESFKKSILPKADKRKGDSSDVARGQITTVYPSFMSHVRRIHSTPQECLSDQMNTIEKVVETGLHDKKDEFPETMQLFQHTKSTGKGTRCKKGRRVIGYIKRRRGSEGNASIFHNSLDRKLGKNTGKNIHLWEFIRDTLLNPIYCPRLIKWEDRNAGVFRFVQSDVVAGMWGEKKNNPKMTYEKLSRAMRYYYNREILERVDGRRLVYKFGKNAHGWQAADDVRKQKPAKVEKVETSSSSDMTSRHYLPNKRSEGCKISVTMEKDILPQSNKRLKLSTNVMKQIAQPDADNHKSAGTQTPPNLSIDSTAVPSSSIPMTDCQEISSPVSVPECVIFVSSADSHEVAQRVEKVDTANFVENSTRSPAGSSSSSISSSPVHQPKLPSADVLLGKHYKIATVAM